jgi:hypothetical protein
MKFSTLRRLVIIAFLMDVAIFLTIIVFSIVIGYNLLINSGKINEFLKGISGLFIGG